MELFEKFNVFSKAELESRAEIEYEFYAKTINIEARTMVDITRKQIIPSVIEYTTRLANSINQVRSASDKANVDAQEEILVQVSDNLKLAKEKLDNLEKKIPVAKDILETDKRAIYFHDEIMKAMKELREPVDKLEMLVEKNAWPMPSYGDLLFGL